MILEVTNKKGFGIPQKGRRFYGENWLIPDEISLIEAQDYQATYPESLKLVDPKPKKEAKTE